MNKYIKTNLGKIPLEDYLDIVAESSGFDDYSDMQNAGYKIDINKEDINNRFPNEKNTNIRKQRYILMKKTLQKILIVIGLNIIISGIIDVIVTIKKIKRLK